MIFHAFDKIELKGCSAEFLIMLGGAINFFAHDVEGALKGTKHSIFGKIKRYNKDHLKSADVTTFFAT